MSTRDYVANVQQPPNYSLSAKVKRGNEDGQSPRLWAPFFLRRPIMIVFLVIFWACLGGLIALYLYTERQNHTLGIETDEDKYFYLWTYGPTAVFTVVTAGWAQVEYRACQLMPWVLMHRGPTPASESIFLDYVSKLNIVSLYQSLKQRHFLVSLCVAGSLLLNGAIVVSTGLFEMDSVPITRLINLTVPAKFSGANFDPHSADGRAFVSCMVFYSRNITRPIGSYKNYVYTPFYPAGLYSKGDYTIPADRSYQANLEIIETFLDCQNATISCEPRLGPWPNQTTQMYETTDGCHYQTQGNYLQSSLVAPGPEIIEVSLDIGDCKGRDLYSFFETDMQSPKSKRDNRTEASTVTPLNSSNWDTDWRLWASIGPVNSSATQNDCSKWYLHPSHAVMCKPRYTAYQGPVKIWREAGESTVSVDIRPQDLNATEGIAGIQASKLIYAGLSSKESLSFDHAGLRGGGGLTFAANGASLDVLLADIPVFTNAMTDFFSCLMQQTVRNGLLQDDLHYIEGEEQSMEGRLFMRQMSFWLMAVLLTMLIVIVIAILCFFVPVTVCPRDTGSIGGIATILSESPDFMAAFNGSQFKSEKRMADSRLSQTQYSTLSDMKGAFILFPQDQATFQSDEASQESSSEWWQPFSSTWFIRIAVIALPIAIIIGLEFVYHISASQRGITLVDGKSQYIHYLWAYIPALLMFIIRCLFTSVEFGTRIMQPYSRLREGFASPETSIFENQLRKIAPYAVFDTLRKKQWALSAATISLLLAVINPIFVSGLFTVKVSGPTFPMNLTQITRWNLGDSLSSGYSIAYYDPKNIASDITTGLILTLNLSYPQWTYNDLAFPQFAFARIDNLLPEAGIIEARIPALRSPLKCALDHANGGCKLQKGEWLFEIDTPCFSNFSTNKTDFPHYPDYFIQTPYLREVHDVLPSNCSTHALVYSKNDPHNRTCNSYRSIYCNATIEEVQVDVRLQLPSLLIDPDTPPRVVESTARTPFVTNAHSFPPFRNLGDYLVQTDPSGISSFLTTISNGLNGVPLPELFDHPERMIDRVSTVWGITMAQLLNSGARESFSSPFNATDLVEPATMQAPIYTGVYHDGRNYLVQNEISTRILQGLLGSMVVCALIALCLMRTKRIIPKSPTCIASIASFLYGSYFMNSGIPSGAEWCSDEELKNQGVFQGQTFSMDWWEMEQPRSHGGSGASRISGDGIDHKRIRFGIDVDRTDRPLSWI